MAKVKARATKTKAKKKHWLKIYSAKPFNEQVIGETHVADSNNAIGKPVIVNLMTLTGDIKKQNKTIILTTHYIEEAEALSDHVAIIDYGELIAFGTPKELMEKYQAKNLEKVFLKITGRRIMEGI